MRRAWCFCTTKIGAPEERAPPAGSGVSAKRRLARYFSMPPGMRPRWRRQAQSSIGAAPELGYGPPMDAEPIRIALPDGTSVSGLWQAPVGATAALVLAHGAGAGMTHRSMAAV